MNTASRSKSLDLVLPHQGLPNLSHLRQVRAPEEVYTLAHDMGIFTISRMERAPYQGPKRKLVLAFDVGTTFSGVSYW
jgi:hypothetical protein